MNIAFFGTPKIAADFLQSLATDTALPARVVLVVTQPDRPVGRKKILTASPVKETAARYQLPIYDGQASSTNLIDLLNKHSIDLCVLFAYGEILTKELLNAPKYGFWNIHPSLLPRYRGASPIAYPLMLGEGESGVSVMLMDSQLDHGPIIGQKRVEVSPTETRDFLEKRLSLICYKIFSELFVQFVQNNYKIHDLKTQDHNRATYTRQLTRQDGYVPRRIIKLALSDAPIITAHFPPELAIIHQYVVKYNWPLPRQKIPAGEMLWNLYRGLHPWPGIWTTVEINGSEKKIKAHFPILL